MKPVPCNGCTACCRGELVILSPANGDDVSQYETDEYMINGRKVFALKHKPNGDCIYLAERGCSIHERSPAVCKAFDCRLWVLRINEMSRGEKKKLTRSGFDLGSAVVEAGRARMLTLV